MTLNIRTKMCHGEFNSSAHFKTMQNTMQFKCPWHQLRMGVAMEPVHMMSDPNCMPSLMDTHSGVNMEL